jgi:hypothetical protein
MPSPRIAVVVALLASASSAHAYGLLTLQCRGAGGALLEVHVLPESRQIAFEYTGPAGSFRDVGGYSVEQSARQVRVVLGGLGPANALVTYNRDGSRAWYRPGGRAAALELDRGCTSIDTPAILDAR